MAHRNRECERRARSNLALHPDSSTMQLNELPRQRQSQARALDLFGRCADLLELLEDRFLILGGNANARIADRHFDGTVYWHRTDFDPAPFWRELDGIREQVEQDLADLPLVGLDLPEPLIDCPLQLNASTPCPLADQHQRIVDGRGEVEVRHLQIHLPRLDLR